MGLCSNPNNNSINRFLCDRLIQDPTLKWQLLLISCLSVVSRQHFHSQKNPFNHSANWLCLMGQSYQYQVVELHHCWCPWHDLYQPQDQRAWLWPRQESLEQRSSSGMFLWNCPRLKESCQSLETSRRTLTSWTLTSLQHVAILLGPEQMIIGFSRLYLNTIWSTKQ